MRIWNVLLTLAVVGLTLGLVVVLVLVVGLGAEVARLRADLSATRPTAEPTETKPTDPATPRASPPQPTDPGGPAQPPAPKPIVYSPDVDLFPDLSAMWAMRGPNGMPWEVLRSQQQIWAAAAVTDSIAYEKHKLLEVMLQHRDMLSGIPVDTKGTEYFINGYKWEKWQDEAKEKSGGRFNVVLLNHLLDGKVKLPVAATTPADKQRLKEEWKAFVASKFPRVPRLSPAAIWDVSILGGCAGVQAVEWDQPAGRVRLKLVATREFDPISDFKLSYWLKLQLSTPDGEPLTDRDVKDQVVFRGYNPSKVKMGDTFTLSLHISGTLIDRVGKIELVSAR